MATADGVFISYRRDDSPAHAGRLFDRICAEIGEPYVFMDVDSIELGVNFYDAIDNALSRCSVLLVVMGPNWLDTSDATGRRRIDLPQDFVRLEIETALRRGIRVIPVLIDGAAMPRSDQLPSGLSELAFRQAVKVSHAQFRSDCTRLMDAITRMLSRTVPSSAAEAPRAAPSAPGSLPTRQPDVWSAALLNTGAARRFGIQLGAEGHVLDIKNGTLAFIVSFDGELVKKIYTQKTELDLTFTFGRGVDMHACDIWAKVDRLFGNFQHTRLTVDGRLVYSD